MQNTYSKLLEKLAEKDKIWRNYAYRLCNNKMLADDLVQEVYLRFHRNPKTQIKDGYVIMTIRSVFLNYLKQKKNISIEQLHYIESHENIFEPTDEQKDILDKANKLEWWKIELIEETFDRSYREIEDIFKINYGFAFKHVKESRNKILDK